MSPVQQQARVEVDLDRKEELILAKQLRACRVNILPRPQQQLSPKVVLKIFVNCKNIYDHQVLQTPGHARSSLSPASHSPSPSRNQFFPAMEPSSPAPSHAPAPASKSTSIPTARASSVPNSRAR